MALSRLEGVEDYVCGRGFLPHPTAPEFQEHLEAASDGIAKARELIESNSYDLIILDEVCWAIHKELVSESSVVELINLVRDGKAIVLTGRFASPELIAIADTVTEMRSIKHGFDQGIPAQKGIEK